MALEIRWIQRFSNFSKALAQLSKFISKGTLNELEEQGLIQSFEYNYELAWNTIKDFYEAQGEINIQGSKDAFRLAFKRGLVEDGDIWMEMVKSRALTAHTYDEQTANDISFAIVNKYYPEFLKLQQTFNSLLKNESTI